MKTCKHKECVTSVDQQEFAKNSKAKDGLQTYCKACKSRMHQKYKAKPGIREKLAASSSDYFKSEAGKAVAKRYKDKYRATEVGKLAEKAYKDAYRESAHGKAVEAEAKEKYNNSEHGRAVNKAYWQTEKGREVRRIMNNKRRQLKQDTSDGSITYESLTLLKESQPNCNYCNKPLDFDAFNGAHLDHYVPLTKGGTDTLDNVVWSCPRCNQSKGCKMPDEFLKE